MALPEHLEIQRRVAISRSEANFHVGTVTSANIYNSLGLDISNRWDAAQWKKEFKVIVNRIDEQDIEFDLVNVDPAIANALRRILIAEIPTMAIEHVFFVNNTSIIADEVLAHRLGLVPLDIDPEKFEYPKRGEALTEKNSVVFKLKVSCNRLSKDKLENDKVHSSALEWLPSGSEMPEETSSNFFASQEDLLESAAKPVHGDILLAKMRPKQCIDLEAHVTKGTGKDHAKWSPVATAWYRLLPEVVLKREVTGKDAEYLTQLCPGLFELQEKHGMKTAAVTSARKHENQLEKVRHLSSEEKWRNCLELRKRKEHFIFTIESVGAQAPDELFIKALDILSAKCDKVLEVL